VSDHQILVNILGAACLISMLCLFGLGYLCDIAVSLKVLKDEARMRREGGLSQ
jgi:hypothetical protein